VVFGANRRFDTANRTSAGPEVVTLEGRNLSAHTETTEENHLHGGVQGVFDKGRSGMPPQRREWHEWYGAGSSGYVRPPMEEGRFIPR